jgi:predicted dithiol-disulfide oxidoreductase (DUF899 family)
MTEHMTATREEWQTARDELLKREKAHTREADELARLRRELPWVPVEKDYSFDTEDGTKTLPELFDGRSQLMVYTFMFGPSYEAGCTVCSSAADIFDGAVSHLNARDVTFLCISRAPLEKLIAYRERMGWGFPWGSSEGSDFNQDFNAFHTEEELKPFLEGEIPATVTAMSARSGTDPAHYVAEAPVLMVFALEDGVVHQTYWTTARGLEVQMSYYGLLDRTPKGRDEANDPDFWIRRHDEY